MIKPVSELRNYPEVLKEVRSGSPVCLTKNETGRYVLIDIADYANVEAAAKKKGKQAKIEVRVLTDLKGTASPTVKVRGKTLAGGTQKDGIANFSVDDRCFVKGANTVEVIAPDDMTLYDFSVRVAFQ